jgi:predicted nucleic acid-binding protein
MRTAIDTNIISAIVSNKPGWQDLAELLRHLRGEGALIVCAPVWAELGAHPLLGGKDITTFLQSASVTVDFTLSKEVWAKAAEAHSAYAVRRRSSGGDTPRRILADFLVGAHALVCTERIITLDHRFTELTFPGLKVVPIPGTSATASS